MKKTELDWKARQVFRIWRDVERLNPVRVENGTPPPADYNKLTEAQRSPFKAVALSGAHSVDVAWVKVKRRFSRTYRSPYREVGLSSRNAVRGR